MSPFVIIILIVVFGLLPFGFILVYTLYRNSVIFVTALSTFVAAMGQSIISFYIGYKGLIHLTYLIPVGLIWLVSINWFAKRYIRKPIQELDKKIKDLSTGNLTFELNKETLESRNEIGAIAQSINELLIQLQKVSTEINASAIHVNSMSDKLSEISVILSKGANTQATSVEELSLSMEEMSSNIAENATNSRDTETMAVETNSDIQVSQQSMQDALETITEISKRISIVNDIAFQTNILALNAAVEAARAGEQGKGFAVVAAEVRKLAERSKVAALDIMALSAKGLDISNIAGKNLNAVVPKIEKTTQLVQHITAASLEQESGAQQMNHAIQSLNQETQNNASLSDDLVQASDELSNQSKALIESVSFFKTKSNKTLLSA